MTATQEREHAILSASGAHRWLVCTPSARLEEMIPEQESEYANEGRLAHEIAELYLRKAFTDPMGPRKFKSELKKLQEKPLYQDEMLKHAEAYLETVSGIVHSYGNTKPYIALEKQLDYSEYVPEGFGTGDCVIIGGDQLIVIDYKYGKGVPVYAEDNPQMKLYALGALLMYAPIYGIEKIKLVIVQPRLSNNSYYDLTTNLLITWAEDKKPIAQQAFEGKGEFIPGEHCQFCRAKALCRARCDFHLDLEDYEYEKPPLLSNEEVGCVLHKAQHLAQWAKHLEKYALDTCLSGGSIPGWKAVEGRSTRAFADTDEAFRILQSQGYEEATLYTREPLSLAEVEKLTGKKEFNSLLANHIIRPPGKPTLALEDDNRKAITQISAQEDFQQEIN